MAITHSTPDSAITPTFKHERSYKVGYVPIKCDRTTPSVHIKGKWLNEVGFEIGTPLTVRIMPGCLVITTEEHTITQNRRLLQEIQQTQQRISEAATTLYNERG